MGRNLSCAKTRPSRVPDNQFRHEPQGTCPAPLTFGTGVPVSPSPSEERSLLLRYMVAAGYDENNVSDERYHTDINETMTRLGEHVIQMSKLQLRMNF